MSFIVPSWVWEFEHLVRVVCDHAQRPDVDAPEREVVQIGGADRGSWRLRHPLRPGETPTWPEGPDDDPLATVSAWAAGRAGGDDPGRGLAYMLGVRQVRHWTEVDDKENSNRLARAEQTFYGELRARIAHLPEEERDAIGRSPLRQRRIMASRKDGRGMAGRWRFHCPDCPDTLPLRHDRLVPILDKLTAAGVSRVTLAQLRTIALA